MKKKAAELAPGDRDVEVAFDAGLRPAALGSDEDHVTALANAALVWP
ncbi:hypothetical protein [Beijerinckia sp. L45]|nr:hypothetical protein [Beijerinckia sp. L45]